MANETLDTNGPPEDLDAYRMLACQGCGTVVRVKRPHSEPMFTDGVGNSWPTFSEPTAPTSCEHCPPPPDDDDSVH